MSKIICNKCGTKNKANSEFCMKCGANLTQYETAGNFNNGVAIVEKKSDNATKNEDEEIKRSYWLIDLYGTEKRIDTDTLPLSLNNNSNITFKKDNKYGFIDGLGTVAIQNLYPLASAMYSDGYAVIATESKRFAVIDSSGNKLWDKEFDGIGGYADYEFCKEGDCYNRVSALSDEGYCYDHYKEKEKKSSSDYSSGSSADIVGTWSGKGLKLVCTSSGVVTLTYEGSTIYGTWEDDGFGYDITFLGAKEKSSAYVHSSYLNFYLTSSTDSIKLYKE